MEEKNNAVQGNAENEVEATLEMTREEEVNLEEVQSAKDDKNVEKKTDEVGNNMAVGMCLGVAFGVVFGPILFHNMGTGIAICLPLGMLLGMSIKSGKGGKK
jgi:uncharacterized membrane protein